MGESHGHGKVTGRPEHQEQGRGRGGGGGGVSASCFVRRLIGEAYRDMVNAWRIQAVEEMARMSGESP